MWHNVLYVINIADIIPSPHNDASQVFQTYFHWLMAGTRSFFGCKFGLISRTSPPLWTLSAEQSGPHWLNSQTLQRKVHVQDQGRLGLPLSPQNHVKKMIFKKNKCLYWKEGAIVKWCMYQRFGIFLASLQVRQLKITKKRDQFSVLKDSQEDTSKKYGTKQGVIKTFFLISDKYRPNTW